MGASQSYALFAHLLTKILVVFVFRSDFNLAPQFASFRIRETTRPDSGFTQLCFVRTSAYRDLGCDVFFRSYFNLAHQCAFLDQFQVMIEMLWEGIGQFQNWG